MSAVRNRVASACRRWLVSIGAVVLFASVVAGGYAYYTSQAAAGAHGKSIAGSINQVTGLSLGSGGITPTANPNVPLMWAATTLADGSAVDGYKVNRYDGSNALQTTAANCDGTVGPAHCTEGGVPDGTWSYGVQATFASNWLGAESSHVTVKVDTSKPTITAKPSDPSNTANPSFSFTHTTFSTFKCKIDGDSFVSCASGVSATTLHGSSLAEGSHTFSVEALDGNSFPTQVATYTWVVDTVAPSVSVSFPANSAAYNAAGWTAVAPIAGTATDATSGIAGTSAITLTITQTATGNTWNGSSFLSGTHTVNPTTYSSGVWTYTFPNANFPADGSYSVAVRATDQASNPSSTATNTFKYDTAAPTAAFTFPAAAGAYNVAGWNATGAITGTATDNGGAGISAIKVAIQDGSGNYYDGTGFTSASIVYLTATGTTGWSYAIAASKLTDGHTYNVTVETIDSAITSNVNASAATRSYDYDTSAPANATLTTNSSYNATSWPGAISGTTTDSGTGSHGVSAVKVSIKDSVSGNCWNGTNFTAVACPNYIAVTSGGSASGANNANWSYSLAAVALTNGHTYTVQVQATDATTTGNTSGNLAAGTFSFDTTAPTMSTLQFFDTSSNGKIDRIIATFNESLNTSYSAPNTVWNLGNAPVGVSISTVSIGGPSNTQAIVTLNEGSTFDTSASGMTLALTANANGVRDLAGNQAAFATTAVADKAPPVPVNVQLANVGTAGQANGGTP